MTIEKAACTKNADAGDTFLTNPSMGAGTKGAIFKSLHEIFIVTLEGMERYSYQRFNLSPFPTPFCIISIASPPSRINQQHRPRSSRFTHCWVVKPVLYRSALVRYVTAGGNDFHQSPGKFSNADVGRAGCMKNSHRTDWLDKVSQFRHWSVNKVGSERFPDCTRLLV